jgi:glucokinase
MDQQNKLAVSIDDDAISMAWVDQDRRLALLEKWPITRFSTLTDALLAYEKSSGKRLQGAACALGVLGVTYGETVMFKRGNWAISRSGFRSIFGCDAIVINNVAACAWATVCGVGSKLDSLSPVTMDAPDFSRRGRWVLTNVGGGVGLAVIDVDELGDMRVLECEMGHCGFAPATEEDRALAKAIAAKGNPLVSWEMVLVLSPGDPIWSAPGLPTTHAERVAMLARLTGRYVGDVVLAHGAWSGAIVTGKSIGETTGGAGLSGFNAGFESKPKYQRLIRATQRWRLAGQDLTLAGCAIVLERHSAMAQAKANLHGASASGAILSSPSGARA